MQVNNAGKIFAVVKSTAGVLDTYTIIAADNNGVNTTPLFSFDPGIDVINDLKLDASNNIYVTGSNLIGAFTSVMSASVDVNGILRWKNIYNGGSAARNDVGNRIAMGTGSVMYVVGTSDNGLPTSNDLIILKHATHNGKRIWIGFSDYNQDNDHGIYINAYNSNDIIVGSVSKNTGTVILDRYLSTTGARSGRGTYTPIPSNPHNSINDISLDDIKISASANLYLTGTLQATDITNQSFSASYLARFNLNLGSRVTNPFKFDFEDGVEGEFNNNYRSVGIALYEPTEDLYVLRDIFFDYTNHQNEFVYLLNYEVPSPLRLASGSVPHNLSVQVFPNPTDEVLQIRSSQELTYLEISDLAGRIHFSQNVTGNEMVTDVSQLN